MSVVTNIAEGLVLRMDSWVNALTGLGTIRDKVSHAVVVPGTRLSFATLETLFNDDDLARRIVTKIPREATRRGFELALEGVSQEDTAEIAREVIERVVLLDGLAKLRDAWIWERLYGGAAIFVGADDGAEPDQPLNESKIRSIEFLNVLRRPDLTVKTRNEDVTSPDFGKPDLYEVKLGQQARGVLIHASRMIIFEGTLAARTQADTRDGWGDSVLQLVYEALQQNSTGWKSAVHLMSDANQGVLKVANLVDLIATGGQEALRTRIQMMDLARSVCRAILVDADREDFQRVPTSFAGLPEMMDRLMMRVASAAEMPVTLLFGRSPAGLNATGESDIRGWYDTVEDARTDVLKPRLERLLRLIMSAGDAPARGKMPERWSVEFPPLWQPTEREVADTLKVKADTHVALVQGQIMMEAESALALAKDFPTIDAEHRRKLLQADIDEGLRPGETGEDDEDESEDEDEGES